MTDHDTEMSNDTVGSDGIFLRAADRRRFDYVMRAVREESLSFSLSSDNDGVLDHYGRLVINKLRKTEGLQIEVFLPQNTEALLERFNQILADISIEDARKAENSPAPRRVLIAHDAKAISTRDLQLLSRLVQDFPGANVSLVFLVDRHGMQLHERTLDAFGQRLLRWPVEAPTRSEGEALLKVARAMGFEVEVKKALAATGYAEIKIVPPKPKAKPAEADTAQARFEAQLAAARKERDIEHNEPRETKERTEPSLTSATAVSSNPAAAPKIFTETPARLGIFGLLLRWIAAIVLMVLVSAAVIVLLFPQKMTPMLASSPILTENLPPWMMEAVINIVGKPPTAALEAAKSAEVAKDNPAPAATVPPTGADSTKEKLDSAVSPPVTGTDAALKNDTAPGIKTDTPVAAATAAVTAVAPVTTVLPVAPAAQAAPTAAAEAAKAAPKADEAKAIVKPEAKPALAEALAPRSERGVDQQVRQAKAGSYFVQHVSLGSMAEAQEWRAQFAALSKAKIAAVSIQDQGIRFVVISGPFASRKEAEAFAARQGVPSDPWLRPVKSLQLALQPGSR